MTTPDPALHEAMQEDATRDAERAGDGDAAERFQSRREADTAWWAAREQSRLAVETLASLPRPVEPERHPDRLRFRNVDWKFTGAPIESHDILLTRRVWHMTAEQARELAAELITAAAISDSIKVRPLGPSEDRANALRPLFGVPLGVDEVRT